MIRLCAIGFLAYGGYQMCRAPLLPLLARDLGASPQMVGVIMSASTLTGVCLKLPAGVWSDAIGRIPILFAASLVFAIMPFSYLLAASLGALIAIRFIHGSATAMMSPVMSATISDLAPADKRATWLSTYATVQGTGQALAPMLTGVLVARGRYDLAFMIAGTVCLATPVLVMRLPMPVARAHPMTARPRFVDGVRAVLSERDILIASVAHASYYIVNGSLNAFLPLLARERLGLTATQIGLLFGAQTITTLAIRPVIGVASDRLGRRGAIVAGLLTCAASVTGISFAGTAAGLLLCVLSYAGGVAISTAATSAFITDVAPRARFGAAHGVFGTIYDIGDASGPLLGGVLAATWGYPVMMRVLASVTALTAVGFAVLTRREPSIDVRPASLHAPR